MTNIFNNLFNDQFKQTFVDAIDALLSQNGLTVKCTLKYLGTQLTQSNLCSNCIYDTISQLSSNIYQSGGPVPFIDNTICPVCLGLGKIKSNAEESVNLAVIFDSKYFINYASQNLNIPAGTVQTLCSIDLIHKIKNAQEIIFDTKIGNYGNFIYERAGEPEPCGLGDNKYIVTMWKRK